MQKIINIGKNGRLLGLLLLAAAGISAGCSTRVESRQASEPAIAKKEAVTATPTPAIKTSTMPETDRRFDGDFEDDMEYSTPSTSKRTAAAVNLNKATFEKIRIGMTLEEVEKLVGEKGMLVGTNVVNGSTKKIYKFANDNFSSYIDVTLENGKVAEKRDKNLK